MAYLDWWCGLSGYESCQALPPDVISLFWGGTALAVFALGTALAAWVLNPRVY